ncbi:MAG: 4Fe-4S cluster-binding domain-containing protein [Prevotella sp.]|nr:4Fe-4S cluster-binding domain-containing protein [Prevotella sp.]
MKRTILLLISHSCNLNCRYCYERFKDSKRMTWNQVKPILEKEFENSNNDIESVDLLGGEPLTNFELIPQICNWVWDKVPAMRIFIRTNGTLLTPEMKSWFISNKKRITLGLSIDGIPEVNLINRGIAYLDIDFFQEHWPNNPLKMTVFPDSVQYLSESLQYFYRRGFNIIGGLAQGVMWDDKSCEELNKQLDLLCDFYLDNPQIDVITPLFDFDFHKSFWIPQSQDEADPPCWEVANIHTYDCDGELLPCHMFSSIIQGKTKRETILFEAAKVKFELFLNECRNCPIRWCCKNCMALNFQHTGNFGDNINRMLMCKAQKVVAYSSARLLIARATRNMLKLDTNNQKEAISNAIRYINLFESSHNE